MLSYLSEFAGVHYVTGRHDNTQKDLQKWLRRSGYPEGQHYLKSRGRLYYLFKKEETSKIAEQYEGVGIAFGNHPLDIAYFDGGIVGDGENKLPKVILFMYVGEHNPEAENVRNFIRYAGLEGVVYTFENWSDVPEMIKTMNYDEWREKALGVSWDIITQKLEKYRKI